MPPTEHNPFEFQEPLLPGSSRGVLVERVKALRHAMQLSQRGGFLTVSAPPHSGVTTFLYSLRKLLPRTLYLDLANLAFVDDPPREAARVLALELARACPELNVPAAPATVSDVLALAASLLPSPGSSFSGTANAGGPQLLTVIVDGFDTWSDAPARKLVLALRAAYTEARNAESSRFSVITGSSMDLRDLTSSGRTSPLNIAQNIFLADFEEKEVTELIWNGLAPVLNYDTKTLTTWAEYTMRWSAGHPAIAQMIGHLAYPVCSHVTVAEAWNEVFPAAREQATRMLASTLEILSNRVELRATASEIYAGVLLPCDRIHRPIRDLMQLGLIRADQNGMARPRNALFAQILAPALNLGVHAAGISTSGSRWASPSSVTEFHLAESLTAPRDESVDAASPHNSNLPGSTSGRLEAGAPGGRAESEFDSAPLIQPGTILGGCQIVRRIGRGGMAEVYLARHIALDTEVAIKVMRQHAQIERRFAQRFLREARAAAQLSHVNIVQIRNVGREGDIQFIEMEYIAGGSLAEIVTDAPFTDYARAERFLRGAAAGIQAAHAKGIIHRDIKPDNLMITHDDRVKVVDFGLAAVAATEGSRLTVEGTIMGTPHFMAPEQWEGKAVDERSDIYSLGATFYNLLTGKPPYDGRTAIELIGNFVASAPQHPHVHNAEIPRHLAHTVMRMIEKNPLDRYASIQELLNDSEGLACNAHLPQGV